MLTSSTTEGGAGTRYIGVSTKMYLGYGASLRWLEQVRGVVHARPALVAGGPVRVFVIPSFPMLESARRILGGTPVMIGAQNCAWGDGPLTGEVSAGMLAEMGVELVEIGHAERRSLFGEGEAVVGRKTAAALAAGITPLLCVGEPERMAPQAGARFCAGQVLSALGYMADDDGGSTGEAAESLSGMAACRIAQLPAAFVPAVAAAGAGDRSGVAQLPAPVATPVATARAADRSGIAQLGSVLLAYEPVWAIGAATPAEPEYVNEVVNALRTLLLEHTGGSTGIIYGGSAGPGILPQLEEVDGLFLGRFAHDPDNLGEVLDEALTMGTAVPPMQ